MNTGDTAWVMISAALVLFMTVGLAFSYGGLEPRRNILQMPAMNVFTIAVVTILWITVGFSLALGPDAGLGLIGKLHYAGLSNMSGVWPGTGIQVIAVLAVSGFTIGATYLLGVTIITTIGLRASEHEENTRQVISFGEADEVLLDLARASAPSGSGRSASGTPTANR
jgi:Amt family ammonium transporter